MGVVSTKVGIIAVSCADIGLEGKKQGPELQPWDAR